MRIQLLPGMWEKKNQQTGFKQVAVLGKNAFA